MAMLSVQEMIKEACSIQRPDHTECAVDLYLAMSPSQFNAHIDQKIAAIAEHCGFNSEEHSDWVSSGFVTKDKEGVLLLDSFRLKYPMCALPDPLELESEFFWKKKEQPQLIARSVHFDQYIEAVIREMVITFDAYVQAMEGWVRSGQPKDMQDCLEVVDIDCLKKAKFSQKKRVERFERLLHCYQVFGAYPHMVQRVKNIISKEIAILDLINESMRMA